MTYCNVRNYFNRVQRAFAYNFDRCFDARRGEMRDDDGTVFRTSAAVSHTVDATFEGARLNLYSYKTLVARMWRVPVGEGVRLFGWESNDSYSVTTTQHMRNITSPLVYKGVRVRTHRKGAYTADFPPTLGEILVAYDYALDQCRDGGQGEPGFIDPMPGREYITFDSDEIGDVLVRVTDVNPPDFSVNVEMPRMATPERMLEYLRRNGFFTHHRKPHVVVREDRHHGYVVNARDKIVGHWRCVPTINKDRKVTTTTTPTTPTPTPT